MFFTETRQVDWLEREVAKYGNATKKGRTAKKIRSNTKLLLGALNKLLKIQTSEVSPSFYENSLRLGVYNIMAKIPCLLLLSRHIENQLGKRIKKSTCSLAF